MNLFASGTTHGAGATGAVNIATAAIVGACMATALAVGGVQAAKGGDPKPVANSDLVQYAAK